ncbi:hypothetical protein LCGC14_1552580 [marine sediment metagenome]|uniref:Uncharacterized protein n=2 Tax=root TaxID=1 RepID=A0A9C9THL0_9HYPH|nr:hypothetical protein [Aurantimonas coralicida]
MNRLRNFYEGTTRAILFTCPACSSSNEIPNQPLDTRALVADGFKLVDGAWSGLCEDCKAKAGDADNAEYDAIVRAATEIGRIDAAGALSVIEIPTAEGFTHAGESHFGFWAVSRACDDASFERFRRTSEAIVGLINRDRGTHLVVNVNAEGTQAIIHGAVMGA